MRLRNNPKARDILDKSEYVIKNPNENYFDNHKPLHIEIGMGKGDFLVGMAKKYPEINFIGIEKFETVMIKALKKIEEQNLDNILLLPIDANDLQEYFQPKSIETIYLNFSDPWPKKRHAKRRLTASSFLSIYEKLLKEDGFIKQKTDDKTLFESSIISYNQYPMDIEYVSVDLHQSERVNDNVMSEYEAKFVADNKPIYAIDVKYKKRNEE